MLAQHGSQGGGWGTTPPRSRCLAPQGPASSSQEGEGSRLYALGHMWWLQTAITHNQRFRGHASWRFNMISWATPHCKIEAACGPRLGKELLLGLVSEHDVFAWCLCLNEGPRLPQL